MRNSIEATRNKEVSRTEEVVGVALVVMTFFVAAKVCGAVASLGAALSLLESGL